MKQNVSQDVGTQGARLKESLIVFLAHGSVGVVIPANDAATDAAKSAGMKASNQLLIIGGSVVNGNLKWLEGGGKSLSFIPKITKMYMDLAGAKFPSSDSLADFGTDLLKAYALYCLLFKDIDYNILPFEDYCYRYAKIKINYDGADHLFSGTPGEQGADTTLSQV